MWRSYVYGRNRPSRAPDVAASPCCLFWQESDFRYSWFILPTCIVSSTAPRHISLYFQIKFLCGLSYQCQSTLWAEDLGGHGGLWPPGRWGLFQPSQEQGDKGTLGVVPALGISHLGMGTGWDQARTSSHKQAQLGWGESGQGCGEMGTGNRYWALEGGWNGSCAMGDWGSPGQEQVCWCPQTWWSAAKPLPQTTAGCYLLVFIFFQLVQICQICADFFHYVYGQIPAWKSVHCPSVETFQDVRSSWSPQRKKKKTKNKRADHGMFFSTSEKVQ